MKIHTFFQSHVTDYNTISHGVYPIRVTLRNNNQSLIRVESVMSPAGGGTGGGLDSPIASTTFSILCFRHFITQVVCKRLQPFVVGVIIGFIGFWFFPHCFRVPFPPPCTPASGGQWSATFPVDFAVVCRKKGTEKRSLFKTYRDMVCPCHPTQSLNLTRMELSPARC